MLNRRRLLVASLATLAAPASRAATPFDPAGKYTLIHPAQPTETTRPGQVEVVDVFWFGCPHCYRFLPYMQAWLKHKPDYVLYRRMPAIFSKTWEIGGRAFYVTKVLGLADKLYVPLFDAMHNDGRNLPDEAAMRKFFAAHGVAPKVFDQTWNSFAVNALVRKSERAQVAYGIEGTPSVVVNGKYLVTGSSAGSYPNMIKVIQALVEREHERELASQ